jgi:hypothetical protein
MPIAKLLDARVAVPGMTAHNPTLSVVHESGIIAGSHNRALPEFDNRNCTSSNP